MNLGVSFQGATTFDDGRDAIIGALIEVHRHLGPGLLESTYEAQVVTYLRLARLPVALLVNFNVSTLKQGLRRLTPAPPLPRAAPMGDLDRARR